MAKKRYGQEYLLSLIAPDVNMKKVILNDNLKGLPN